MSGSVRQESPLEVALKGAGAGLAGTLVLTLAMQAAERLMTSTARVESPTPDPTGRSQDAPTGAPTERLVEKVASGVFEAELSPGARQTLGMGIHWGYGALWGTGYGLIQTSRHLRSWLHPPLFGLIVWVVGPMGLIPAMKLAERPTDRSPRRRLVSILLHQVYGWSTASTFHVLSRDA